MRTIPEGSLFSQKSESSYPCKNTKCPQFRAQKCCWSKEVAQECLHREGSSIHHQELRKTHLERFVLDPLNGERYIFSNVKCLYDQTVKNAWQRIPRVYLIDRLRKFPLKWSRETTMQRSCFKQLCRLSLDIYAEIFPRRICCHIVPELGYPRA